MNSPHSSSSEVEALLQKAEDKLESARIIFDNCKYDDAVSRAYYAVFHAISAALLSKGLFFSSHGRVIGAFNREFIKTGVFPKEFTDMIQGLFEDRQTGDYGVLMAIDKETAQKRIDDTEIILNAVLKYLAKE